ncbi:MAG: hypothetical protein ACLSHO_08320 [Dysosmobacter sp.]
MTPCWFMPEASPEAYQDLKSWKVNNIDGVNGSVQPERRVLAGSGAHERPWTTSTRW